MSFTNDFSRQFGDESFNELHLQDGLASSVDFVMIVMQHRDMSRPECQEWIGEMALKHPWLFDRLQFRCFDNREEMEYALSVGDALELLCF